MQYTTIANTDLKVSALCLGTWVFGGDFWGGAKERDCIDAVLCAIDHGINFIDTAPIYGNGVSEETVGKALKGKRDKVVLATKCGLTRTNEEVGVLNDLSPQAIRREIEDSLRRLNTDYVDLYQCHWPDEKVPVEQTMTELLRLKEEGKIKHIGVSNYGADLLQQAMKVAPIVTSQDQYSLLDRSIEDKLLPFLNKHSIGLLAYGPLAGGILTGKYKQEPQFPKADARTFLYQYYEGAAFKKTQNFLQDLKKIGRPLNQIAINWVRQQPGVASVIVGCRNPKQVEDNIAAIDWDSSEQELRQLQGIQA